MISDWQPGRAGHLVEQAVTLNIDQFIRLGALTPGSSTSGQVNWTFGSGQAGFASFAIKLLNPDSYLQIDFLIRDRATGVRRDVRQKIVLVTTKPHFGGMRWWFVCPINGDRVGRLHLPSDASVFASRRAHSLTYACRGEGVYARAARRSRKLTRKLDADPLIGLTPLKPKWMRWKTYLRCISQIKKLEGVALSRGL